MMLKLNDLKFNWDTAGNLQSVILADSPQDNSLDHPLVNWYRAYLADPTVKIDPALREQLLTSLNSKTLQQEVLRAMAQIPVGETVSYQQLAQKAGTGPRVVASWCKHNPWPLLFPCQRVVKADGSIGKYSLGGAKIKQQLLAYEQTALGRVSKTLFNSLVWAA